MREEQTYLCMLLDTLEQKQQLLQSLLEETRKQRDCLQEVDHRELDDQIWGSCMERKEQLLEKLEELDQGFSKVYERVKLILQKDRESHRAIIEKLQEKVREITEQSIQLQTLEQKNKAKIQVYFTLQKEKIKTYKVSSQIVDSYKKNMQAVGASETYFLDQKK